MHDGIPLTPYRVLLVEDFAMTSSFLSTTLKYCRSAHVVCASTGKAALDIMNDSGPFDVIITDIHMVGMDGVEFIRALRTAESAAGWTPQTVVAMSADESSSGAAEAAGCNMFIFKYSEPVKALLEIMDRARAERSASGEGLGKV